MATWEEVNKPVNNAVGHGARKEAVERSQERAQREYEEENGSDDGSTGGSDQNPLFPDEDVPANEPDGTTEQDPLYPNEDVPADGSPGGKGTSTTYGPDGSVTRTDGTAGGSIVYYPDGTVAEQGIENERGNVADQARRLENQVVAQNDSIRAEDVRVTRQGGRLRAELTEHGRQRQRDLAERQVRRQAIDQTPADSPDDIVVTWNDGKATARYSDAFNTELKQKAKRKRRTAPQEEFGDVSSIPYVGGSAKDIENAIRAATTTYGEWGQKFGDASRLIVDYGPLAPTGSFSSVTRLTRHERDIANDLEAVGVDVPDQSRVLENFVAPQLRDYAEGSAEGAAAIGNVPGVALSAIEASEFVGWAANEAAEGRGGEAGRKSLEAGGAAAVAALDYSTSHPSKSAGMLTGSLVASGGVMGATAEVSPRLGAATRYAIQPGEEALTAGATAGLKLAPFIDGEKWLSKIPNGRLDNEEVVMAAADYAGPKVARKLRRIRYDIAERRVNGNTVSKFLSDERAQMDTSGVERPRSPSPEVETQEDYSAPPDLLDDATSQYQDYLRDAAEREVDATRDLVDDLDHVERSSVGADDVGPTIDYDELEAQRRRYSRAFDEESSGPSVDAGDRSVDWSEYGRVNTETEYELERERERARTAEAAMSDVATAPTVDYPVDTEFRVDQRFDIGVDTEFQVDQEFEQEYEQEFEQEYDTELEFEQEYETETEQEREREQEIEIELERELERETERESEGWGEPKGDVVDLTRIEWGGWSKTWSSGFASIDEVLRDDLGGR